jgi:hypothetical protein
MLTALLILLAAAEGGSPQVKGYKISPLTLFDNSGNPIGQKLSKEMPPPPVPITGTNEFGYLQIQLRGQIVYIRPGDVRHTMPYCSGGTVVRRDSGARMGASRPGVRRGAGEDDGLCIPQ